MIVSNYNSSAPSAIQGIDFLGRSSKVGSKEKASSSFSDLLEVNGAPVASTAEPRQVLSNSRNAPSSKDSGSPKQGSAEAAPSKSSPEPVERATADDFGASGGAGTLADQPPIIRDPRLEDPEELALEAAAIAIAATLLPQNQGPVLTLVMQDEGQSEVGTREGGNNAEAGKDTFVAPPVSLAVVAGNETGASAFLTDATQAAFNGAELSLSAKGDSKSGRTEEASAESKVAVTNMVSVVPRVVPAVVVTATSAEAAVLAAQGGRGIFAGQNGQELAAQTVLETGAFRDLAAPSSGLQGEFVASADLNGAAAQPTRSEAGEIAKSQVLSDAEFLASAAPSNPAVAFFAAQSDKREASSNLRQVQGTEAAQEFVSVQSTDASIAESDGAFDGQSGGEGLGSGGGTERIEVPAPPAAHLQQAKVEFDAESQPDLGTVAAKEGFVQRESSPVLVQSEGSSAGVKPVAEESSSSVSSKPSLDFLGGTSSSAGIPSEASARVSSRPTVLPPVTTRFSELNNVINNALERARSENPSHLAVEVRLEDGSSFGLEVRMSNSGLQASFKSESQPLLKALENSWAGFLAKDSADQRVASASFEGRAGFGDFSNNGSNAGERRQQFEDGASAALLSGLEGHGVSSKTTQGEKEGKSSATDAGMALYA